MKSRTTAHFRSQLEALPEDIKRQAKRVYRKFRHDPWHNSLRFKQVHARQQIFSVRVSRGYRAVGKRGENGMLWFWIGSHADYDELIKRQ